MVYGNKNGSLVLEGALMTTFLDNYNLLKHEDGANIGWELINKHFHED
jgi:hypothetical protein